MKKKILVFLAGLVSAVAVGLYLWFRYYKIHDKAFQETSNKTLKEGVEVTEEQFISTIEEKRKEIQNAKTEEIVSKVHSFFGLDS